MPKNLAGPMFLAITVPLMTVLRVSPADEPKASAQPPIRVNVLALNFDPIIPNSGGRRLHEEFKWNDPRKLADGYVDDIRRASSGFIDYTIVEWKDVDGFNVKTDGYRYTLDEYLKCHKANKGWHEPDGLDYPRTLDEFQSPALIDAGAIDEVWLFGPPYAGYWESAMAGPRAFYINGGVYPDVKCGRPFAIMGFNYERGVAEMVHDLSHRTESTMARIFGGWKAEELTTDWARFAACAAKAGDGRAGCGDCHNPPNAEKDYDYENPRSVESTAEDWRRYPNLTGARTRVSRESWGGPDYHRNYMTWWFMHLPSAPGVHPVHGRQNNWWKYVFDFDAYTEGGKPKSK
jgi:hypothetical protein